jgi:hypothetical protein
MPWTVRRLPSHVVRQSFDLGRLSVRRSVRYANANNIDLPELLGGQDKNGGIGGWLRFIPARSISRNRRLSSSELDEA